ncbi:hypothetical protein [Inquilinus sp. CAU 1745]|uniref:hypothetical protein n=1 Tax=Inquilinus sp. CAU 1745 TaxID=3140369 RepID=UPI00325C0F3E
MMFRPLLIAGSLAMLTACAAQSEAPPGDRAAPPASAASGASGPAVCETADYAWAVGEPWEAVRERVEAQVEAENLTLRALGSGDPMTMDYRRDRLTLVYTDKGVVESVDCV